MPKSLAAGRAISKISLNGRPLSRVISGPSSGYRLVISGRFPDSTAVGIRRVWGSRKSGRRACESILIIRKADERETSNHRNRFEKNIYRNFFISVCSASIGDIPSAILATHRKNRHLVAFGVGIVENEQ